MKRKDFERVQRIILRPNLPLELRLKEFYSFVFGIVMHIPKKGR
jgi:hypothetical protein